MTAMAYSPWCHRDAHAAATWCDITMAHCYVTMTPPQRGVANDSSPSRAVTRAAAVLWRPDTGGGGVASDSGGRVRVGGVFCCLPSTARSMMVGRVFLVLTGACQFGHGLGGFATNLIHSLCT